MNSTARPPWFQYLHCRWSLDILACGLPTSADSADKCHVTRSCAWGRANEREKNGRRAVGCKARRRWLWEEAGNSKHKPDMHSHRNLSSPFQSLRRSGHANHDLFACMRPPLRRLAHCAQLKTTHGGRAVSPMVTRESPASLEHNQCSLEAQEFNVFRHCRRTCLRESRSRYGRPPTCVLHLAPDIRVCGFADIC